MKNLDRLADHLGRILRIDDRHVRMNIAAEILKCMGYQWDESSSDWVAPLAAAEKAVADASLVHRMAVEADASKAVIESTKSLLTVAVNKLILALEDLEAR